MCVYFAVCALLRSSSNEDAGFVCNGMLSLSISLCALLSLPLSVPPLFYFFLSLSSPSRSLFSPPPRRVMTTTPTTTNHHTTHQTDINECAVNNGTCCATYGDQTGRCSNAAFNCINTPG